MAAILRWRSTGVRTSDNDYDIVLKQSYNNSSSCFASFEIQFEGKLFQSEKNDNFFVHLSILLYNPFFIIDRRRGYTQFF